MVYGDREYCIRHDPNIRAMAKLKRERGEVERAPRLKASRVIAVLGNNEIDFANRESVPQALNMLWHGECERIKKSGYSAFQFQRMLAIVKQAIAFHGSKTNFSGTNNIVMFDPKQMAQDWAEGKPVNIDLSDRTQTLALLRSLRQLDSDGSSNVIEGEVVRRKTKRKKAPTKAGA